MSLTFSFLLVVTHQYVAIETKLLILKTALQHATESSQLVWWKTANQSVLGFLSPRPFGPHPWAYNLRITIKFMVKSLMWRSSSWLLPSWLLSLSSQQHTRTISLSCSDICIANFSIPLQMVYLLSKFRGCNCSKIRSY